MGYKGQLYSCTLRFNTNESIAKQLATLESISSLRAISLAKKIFFLNTAFNGNSIMLIGFPEIFVGFKRETKKEKSLQTVSVPTNRYDQQASTGLSKLHKKTLFCF